MSIFFVHLFSELFILSFFAGYLNRRFKTLEILLAAAVGLLFGYIAYFIFDFNKAPRIGIVSANIALVVSFILVFISPLIRTSAPAIFAMSGALFMRYFFKASAFPIFEGSLLDTEGIINFAFILLAVFVCFVFFMSFRFFARHSLKLPNHIAALLIAAMGIIEALGEWVLYLIRTGAIEDADGIALSFSAKAAYYAQFYSYGFLIIGMIVALISLKARPNWRDQQGDFDIDYRLIVAKTSAINAHCCVHFIISLIALIVAAYFYMVASKPISIDPPQVITPNTDKYFTFDLAKITDGHLHRYAYINANGKKIRWFIINRFPGKITPVAVFDSCMICGDLGYIERDGELVCVACNVRIFIPSVGKAGGCNPIPIENFEIDEANGLFKIPIKEIKAGENYFSEVVEISVKDPVNGEEFLNTQAASSYLYNGVNYYFVSRITYEKFKEDPEKYAPKDASARFRLKG